MTNISRLEIEGHKNNEHWDFSNKILYDLCRDNFKHNQDNIILTKVLFIGRIYAAAIERRKKDTNTINDDFYIKIVAPRFKDSYLDKHLSELRNIKKLKEDNLLQVLEVHHYLTTILFKITNLNKRSFSSKYLHFHLPHLFFIYDSRAVTAVRDFITRVPKKLQYLTKQKKIDREYATFFCKCFDLKTQIEQQQKTKLSNRQLDNLLIEVANKK